MTRRPVISDNTRMVRTRVFFGFLLTLAFVGVIALDAWLTQQTIPDWSWLAGRLEAVGVDYVLQGGLLTAVIALLIGWGVLEMGKVCRAAGHQPAVAWALLASVVLILLPWLSTTPVMGNRSPEAEWQNTGQWLATCVVISIGWVLLRRQTAGATASMASTLFMIMYLGFLGSFVVRLRIRFAGPAGAWIVLYYIAVTKFTDVGAYFTGITLGRHPLAPQISPKKTIEGFIGGLVWAAVVAVILPRFAAIIAPSEGLYLTIGRAVVFGLVVGLIGQAGDLVESLVKRDAQIKDSGSLVPTFGGVLDIIDSPLLTAPVAWWLLTRWLT
jgi:phosphatidate cytidylyltransferase